MSFFHVSSVLNRDSVAKHGLDWRLMGPARGIAGSHAPEAEGVFLCRDELECDYFVRMNNTGGLVDIWRVDRIDPSELIDNGNGYVYKPGTIAASGLTLIRKDL